MLMSNKNISLSLSIKEVHICHPDTGTQMIVEQTNTRQPN